MADTTEESVKEHVKNMGLPESIGRQILDAREQVEQFLNSRAEIARITKEEEAGEDVIKEKKRKVSDNYYSKIRSLETEEHKEQAALDGQFKAHKDSTTNALKPHEERIKQMKRIIALLKIAESYKPVPEVKDDDVTAYHGEYLEWLDYVYNDDFLRIRLLIVENRKPKNKYTLMAYGRCAFTDKCLIQMPRTYGGPNLKDWRDGREQFSIILELGSFPKVEAIKTWASKNKAKILRDFIATFEALKGEYQDVTERYRLSDFAPVMEMVA